jgi:TetR/AcrR family transcriptional regulator, cholesterol catabolism regulator
MTGTRERLLTAATAVFAARGYQATAVQDVADAVGVQKSSVYKHFSSKEQLLLGCLERGHALREEVLDLVAAHPGPAEARLHEYLRRYVATMLAHQDLSAVFARERLHLSAERAAADLARRRARGSVLVDLVHETAAPGVEAPLVAHYLRGAMHACLDWYRPDGPDPRESVAERFADTACGLVRAARPSTPPSEHRAGGEPAEQVVTGRAVGARAPRSRRDAIDDAALRVVRAKGFAAPTVQDVAAEAGVLKGSVYHYIASKDELLMRIFEAAHLELTTIVGTVAQLDVPPERQFVELVRLQTLWFLDNLDQAVVLFREWPFLTGENRRTVAARRRALERFAARLLEQTDHGLRTGAGATARFAIGAANAVADWYRPDGAWSAAAVADGFADQTAALVATAVRRPAE